MCRGPIWAMPCARRGFRCCRSRARRLWPRSISSACMCRTRWPSPTSSRRSTSPAFRCSRLTAPRTTPSSSPVAPRSITPSRMRLSSMPSSLARARSHCSRFASCIAACATRAFRALRLSSSSRRSPVPMCRLCMRCAMTSLALRTAIPCRVRAKTSRRWSTSASLRTLALPILCRSRACPTHSSFTTACLSRFCAAVPAAAVFARLA